MRSRRSAYSPLPIPSEPHPVQPELLQLALKFLRSSPRPIPYIHSAQRSGVRFPSVWLLRLVSANRLFWRSHRSAYSPLPIPSEPHPVQPELLQLALKFLRSSPRPIPYIHSAQRSGVRFPSVWLLRLVSANRLFWRSHRSAYSPLPIPSEPHPVQPELLQLALKFLRSSPRPIP